MSSVVKIGPWGRGSKDYDIAVAPLRLESITLKHGHVVDSLSFCYQDRDKRRHTTEPWGGYGGEPDTITLGPSEFVTEVHGEYGHYPDWGVDAIANLTFVTNLERYGPYGCTSTYGWDSFSVPVKNNGSIVGFFAQSDGRVVNAIGVYVKPF